ncbi:MAG: site-specific integrase [Alphaproteobacteria bacterium]|nr:site-specific integrase [Alphaproteobacteria bacterium]
MSDVRITKRERHRKLRDGKVVKYTRFVLNFRDPKTGQRRQEFFERQKEAQARRVELLTDMSGAGYVARRDVPVVAAVLEHWVDDRRGRVKSTTLAAHLVVLQHVRRPLGKIRLSDLSTAAIRAWHGHVADTVGAYSANRAASLLRSILALAEEDFGIRAPVMPSNLARRRSRPKKAILTPQQIGVIVAAAQADPEHGIYYAFPFLAGTRPSEQLGLHWDDVDFEQGVIRICRIQERDGSLTEMTKTAAGTRDVPMGPTLKAMLLDWRIRCPRHRGELERVFPGPGRLQPWPKPRLCGGGPLLYQNFLHRYWRPVFARLGSPYVTPHSARHSFISTLQAKGIEVGLVAKLAGHANAVVTLGHYTQAVRGGEGAVAALEEAYRAVS